MAIPFLIENSDLVFDLIVDIRLCSDEADAIIIESGWNLQAVKAANDSIEIGILNRLSFVI